MAPARTSCRSGAPRPYAQRRRRERRCCSCHGAGGRRAVAGIPGAAGEGPHRALASHPGHGGSPAPSGSSTSRTWLPLSRPARRGAPPARARGRCSFAAGSPPSSHEASHRLTVADADHPVGIKVDGWIYPSCSAWTSRGRRDRLSPSDGGAGAAPRSGSRHAGAPVRQGGRCACPRGTRTFYDPLLRRRWRRHRADPALLGRAHRLAPLDPCGNTWAKEIPGAAARVRRIRSRAASGGAAGGGRGGARLLPSTGERAMKFYYFI